MNSERYEPMDKLKKPTCFVMMPIADVAGYDSGHFTRVYEHIIKPACERAGFTPKRADESTNSNIIIVDILKSITDSDVALCDLSGLNPNVFYELGLRQAFNKKTIIIKDEKTSNPFDTNIIRYTPYNSSLRIDSTAADIAAIAKMIDTTVNHPEEYNSITQLLKITPAHIENKTQLSQESTIIMNQLLELNKKISSAFESRPRINDSHDLSTQMTMGDYLESEKGWESAVNRYFTLLGGLEIGYFKKAVTHNGDTGLVFFDISGKEIRIDTQEVEPHNIFEMTPP